MHLLTSIHHFQCFFHLNLPCNNTCNNNTTMSSLFSLENLPWPPRIPTPATVTATDLKTPIFRPSTSFAMDPQQPNEQLKLQVQPNLPAVSKSYHSMPQATAVPSSVVSNPKLCIEPKTIFWSLFPSYQTLALNSHTSNFKNYILFTDQVRYLFGYLNFQAT